MELCGTFSSFRWLTPDIYQWALLTTQVRSSEQRQPEVAIKGDPLERERGHYWSQARTRQLMQIQEQHGEGGEWWQVVMAKLLSNLQAANWWWLWVGRSTSLLGRHTWLKLPRNVGKMYQSTPKAWGLQLQLTKLIVRVPARKLMNDSFHWKCQIFLVLVAAIFARLRCGYVLLQHHCRRCGQVFCSSCCNGKMALPRMCFIDPVRQCGTCLQVTVRENEFFGIHLKILMTGGCLRLLETSN